MKSCTILSLLSVCCCCVILQCRAQQEPIVNIPALGGLRGSQMVSSSGRNFHAFRSIPYAEPPVGNLRFSDPIAAKPWTGRVLDATKEGPTCLQNDLLTGLTQVGQEDCLVLNVYTHKINDAIENALPVMVWIHGGGFSAGSGNFETDFYGPGKILDRDVVLVTINYRVGPFGFLSTEDKEAPGNYGLLDQTLAIKWVKDHIANFGGNPDSITIFGESAGGASVQFQVLSPHSKGLFHRAISQSGAPGCPWAIQKSVGEYTRLLAEDLNCPTSNSRELLACLRNMEAAKILEFKRKLVIPIALSLVPVAFGPRIDSERDSPFLPDDPEVLVSRKQFNQVPMIVGLTKDEGSLFSASLASIDGKNLEVLKKDPLNCLAHAMGMEKQKNGREIAQKAYDHYFGTSESDDDFVTQYGKMASDVGFFKCIDDSVKVFSQYNGQPVYYYNYAHKGQHSITQMLGVPDDIDFGVSHSDELMLMFTSNFIPPTTDANDIKASKMLLDLWTSFAANGVPQSEEVIGHWLPTTQPQPRYLQINLESPVLINGEMPFQSGLDFWRSLLNSYSNVPSVKEEL
ncbi:venom carboxylesterase-6-like isoform X1 [Daphnia pulicaria]|uniref:venom carboxylesterase-6-like isoform X1 n=1 Tax=Daphnia pulicaria TaxID=35523 RepID=UPI001EEA6955|nr:venom carboxylesterase-6-like isoform X1 [Daphnia pulicaria]